MHWSSSRKDEISYKSRLIYRRHGWWPLTIWKVIKQCYVCTWCMACGAQRWLSLSTSDLVCSNIPVYTSYPLSLLKRESTSVACIHSASFITSYIVWLARCRIVIPLQSMGWSSDQLSMLGDHWLVSLLASLTQVFLCSLSLVSRSFLVSLM